MPIFSPRFAWRECTIIEVITVKTGPIVAIVEASIGLVYDAPIINIYHHPKITSRATINIEPKSLSDSRKKPPCSSAVGVKISAEKSSCNAKSWAKCNAPCNSDTYTENDTPKRIFATTRAML